MERARAPGSGQPRYRLSHNVDDLETSPTLAIQERASALRAQGRPVRRLGLGQSPFPVPDPLVEALRARAGEKDYLPTAGLPALRAAIAEYHRRKPNVHLGAEDVLVGPGSKELLFLLQIALDGQVLVPTPAWVSYAPQARLLARRIRYLHTSAADGWQLDPHELDRACAEHDGPYLLVLNDPSNPTGTSHEPDRQRAIAEICRKHGVIVLSDEIYGELRFDGRPRSIAEHWPEGTILATGLSKWCGAGGWRLGAFAFPPELRGVLRAMTAAASETYTTTSAPIQYAAVGAFAGAAFPDWMERYLVGARRVLARLTAESARRLRAAGAEVVDPSGAFYLFPDLGPHRERLARRGIADAPRLCERLLAETGVMCLPGRAFARPADELTVRLALVDFDGAAALAQDAAEPGGDAPAVAPVLEAIDLLCAWMNR